LEKYTIKLVHLIPVKSVVSEDMTFMLKLSTGVFLFNLLASARYSDIAVMPDGTIVVVFMLNNTSASNGAPLHVVRFNMDWLLE